MKHQVIGSLSFRYFEEAGQDPSLYELEKMVSDFDKIEETDNEAETDAVQLGIVANKRKLLRKQLEVVCRMLSDAVLQNSTAFQDELARVIDLQNSLKEAMDVVFATRG